MINECTHKHSMMDEQWRWIYLVVKADVVAPVLNLVIHPPPNNKWWHFSI